MSECPESEVKDFFALKLDFLHLPGRGEAAGQEGGDGCHGNQMSSKVGCVTRFFGGQAESLDRRDLVLFFQMRVHFGDGHDHGGRGGRGGRDGHGSCHGLVLSVQAAGGGDGILEADVGRLHFGLKGRLVAAIQLAIAQVYESTESQVMVKRDAAKI